MQPCAVCGGVVVDAAGYCVQCGTFRGVPAQPAPPYPQPAAQPYPPVAAPPAYPTSAPPQTYPQPYPTSAPPHPYPTSGPPQVSFPTSAPPHGYPQGYPAPTKQRSPFVIPLIALSATLVVLVVAIVVVVMVRSGGEDPIANPPVTSSRSPSIRSGIDPCVVGRWRVTAHEELLAIDDVGDVPFTGSGATLQLNADGTGLTDYGTGTRLQGVANGRTILLVISGSVSYRYHAANGAFSLTDVRANVQGVVLVDGKEAGRRAVEGSDDPSNYTCSGGGLTQRTNRLTVQMTRV